MIKLKIFEWDALFANNLAIKYHASFQVSLENKIGLTSSNEYFKLFFINFYFLKKADL